MKHTSGPWEVSDNVTKHNDTFRHGIIASERVIAWTLRHFDRDPSNCKVTDQDDGDARLIASAPRMYDWMKRMKPSWDEEAEAIIKEIEG